MSESIHDTGSNLWYKRLKRDEIVGPAPSLPAGGRRRRRQGSPLYRRPSSSLVTEPHGVAPVRRTDVPFLRRRYRPELILKTSDWLWMPPIACKGTCSILLVRYTGRCRRQRRSSNPHEESHAAIEAAVISYKGCHAHLARHQRRGDGMTEAHWRGVLHGIGYQSRGATWPSLLRATGRQVGQ